MYKYCFTELDYHGIPITTMAIHNHNYMYHRIACEFLIEKSTKNGTKATLRAYASDLCKFLNIINTNNSINTFDIYNPELHNIRVYLNGLKNDGLSDSSLRRNIATLHEFYKFLKEFGYSEYTLDFDFRSIYPNSNLGLVNKATSQILSKYIHESDLENILAHVKTKSEYKRKRDQFAIKAGYYLGCRAHELINKDNFKISKLKKELPEGGFLEKGHIRIIGKGNKSRTVLITSLEFKRDLYKILYSSSSKHFKKYIFETPSSGCLTDPNYATATFKEAVNCYLAENLVSEDMSRTYMGLSYHSLRHTFATNLVTFCEEEGYDTRIFLPQWLGHSQIETSNLYICAQALLKKKGKPHDYTFDSHKDERS